MFKRISLALLIVAALGVAGLGVASSAEARGGFHGVHRAYYPGYIGYYSPPIYPSYYASGYTYASPYVYFRGGGHGFHHHRRHHHHHHGHHRHHRHGHGRHHHRGGVSFSIGF